MTIKQAVLIILGWSDLPLFGIFEIGHISADQVYFYELNCKKSANLTACEYDTRSAKFSFSKNHRDLKMKKFLPFTSKNIRQKEKFSEALRKVKKQHFKTQF